MVSKAKKTKRIRDRKKRPHQANLKADMKRLEKNREILRDLAVKDEK